VTESFIQAAKENVKDSVDRKWIFLLRRYNPSLGYVCVVIVDDRLDRPAAREFSEKPGRACVAPASIPLRVAVAGGGEISRHPGRRPAARASEGEELPFSSSRARRGSSVRGGPGGGIDRGR